MFVCGIGVDLIAQSRIKKLLRTHGSQKAARILTASEKRDFYRNRCSSRYYGKLFVAKEAFSKALGCPLTGPHEFCRIDVKILPQNHFRVKSSNFGTRTPEEAVGCFFMDGDLLGAHVVRWKPGSGK